VENVCVMKFAASIAFVYWPHITKEPEGHRPLIDPSVKWWTKKSFLCRMCEKMYMKSYPINSRSKTWMVADCGIPFIDSD